MTKGAAQGGKGGSGLQRGFGVTKGVRGYKGEFRNRLIGLANLSGGNAPTLTLPRRGREFRNFPGVVLSEGKGLAAQGEILRFRSE